MNLSGEVVDIEQDISGLTATVQNLQTLLNEIESVSALTIKRFFDLAQSIESCNISLPVFVINSAPEGELNSSPGVPRKP